MTRLVFAPNWIGDAMMALPAVADIRRQDDAARLVVAARPGVADVMALVPGVDQVIRLSGGTVMGGVRRLSGDVAAVRTVGADAAILFPNSARAAVLARRAGIGERWGYRTDLRRLLLTRAIRKPSGAVHQVDYYRHLVAALGFANGPREPRLDAPAAAVEAARGLLTRAGWDGLRRIIGIAPGAAYGGAKRWPPDRFAAVIRTMVAEREAACVIVGNSADAPTVRAIEAALREGTVPTPGTVINLVGQTDIATLCGVLSFASAFVSNDSGGMHLAAALGVPAVAMFGPTDERATSPVGVGKTALLVTRAWCRPCMLRECPLDHRCMTGIPVADVVEAVDAVGAVKE